LTVVAEDAIIEDFGLGTVAYSYTSFPIGRNMVILLNPGEVFRAFEGNTVLQILFDPVVLDDGIRSEQVLGLN